MAVHRYWRATALQTYGDSGLVLSCLHLLDSTSARLDAAATLTSNVATSTGTLANLQDTDLSTSAGWPVQSIAAYPRLTVNWDFGGTTVDVTDIRIAGNVKENFLLQCELQWSDDSVAWTTSKTFWGINWPGVLTLATATTNSANCRVGMSNLIAVGTGPTLIYGRPVFTTPNLLTVQSGSVKDYSSGVLGQGIGRITGTVKVDATPDVPVYRKVRLIRERDSLLMRELWSNPTTGAYDFTYIDELQTYTVVSYDHTKQYRAVIADRQIPTLMTDVVAFIETHPVSLLLHFDGANGSTTFTDSSLYRLSASAGGGAAIDTSQSFFGGSSLSLNGSSQYLSYPSNDVFDFATGDFTTECWFRTTTNADYQMLFGRQEPGTAMAFQVRLFAGKAEVILRDSAASGGFTITGTTTVPLNTFQHLAVVRQSGVTSLYLQGVLQGSASSPGLNISPAAPRPLTIGCVNNSVPSGFFSGHIDEVRIVKGVAMYTSAFTPPTTSFTI